MALLTTVQHNALTDRFSGFYDQKLANMGSKTQIPPTLGTARWLINQALVFSTALADYEEEQDLNSAINQAFQNANVEFEMAQELTPAIQGLDSHFQFRGQEIAAAIQDTSTFLNYYNGGSGGALFSGMVTPSYAFLYNLIRSRALPQAGVLQPAINPTNGAANGMGTFNVAGAVYTAGAAINALYSQVNLVLVITANWGAGAGAAVVTATGVDHTGAVMTWTFNVPQNQVAALAGQTITPALTAQARQVVAVSPNANGIVAGSWITLNNGLVDQERVLVELVAGANITIVCKQAHNAGATVTGNYTVVGTPGTGGRRCASITGIALTTPNGHTSGQCRVEGVQDRVGI